MKVVYRYIFIGCFFASNSFAEGITNENQVLAKIEYLQGNLNVMMQDTALWLDSFAGEDKSKKTASANGYLQLGWLPRTADFGDNEIKLKVRLRLPHLSETFSVVFDNDDEDDIKLDYEVDPLDTKKDDLNLAVQYIKKINDALSIKNRLGISRQQLYLRSEIKKKWLFEHFQFILTPRLDYFHSDGWAPSLKAVITYPLKNNLLSFSTSWQKVQKDNYPRRKAGLYHIKNMQEQTLVVTGLQYTKNQNDQESYLISSRYRHLFHKNWLFYEIEPFIEFKQKYAYRREAGLMLRLIAYYGR